MNAPRGTGWLARLARLLVLPLAVLLAAILFTLRAESPTNPPIETTTTTVVAEKMELMPLIPAFEQAFFGREPGLSFDEYIAGLSAYADASFIDTLPRDGFPSDRQISVSLSSEPQISYDQDETVALVTTSLEIEETKDSETITTSNFEHVTEWRYDNGQWLVYPSLPR